MESSRRRHIKCHYNIWNAPGFLWIMVACKHTPSWTQWGFLIALGIPHCIDTLPFASKCLAYEIKTNQSFWICFHDAPTSLWKHKQHKEVDDDLLHTDEKTYTPVLFLIPDLILLNINNLMILIHAGLAWWSKGRRWGSGSVVEHCQAQAFPPKSWRLQGGRTREGK